LAKRISKIMGDLALRNPLMKLPELATDFELMFIFCTQGQFLKAK